MSRYVMGAPPAVRKADVRASRRALRLRLAEVSVPAVVVVAGQDATEGQDATGTTPAAQRPAQQLWRRLGQALRRRI